MIIIIIFISFVVLVLGTDDLQLNNVDGYDIPLPDRFNIRKHFKHSNFKEKEQISMEDEIIQRFSKLPYGKLGREIFAKSFIEKVLLIYNSPQEQKYFGKKGYRLWTVDSSYLTLTVIQKRENPLQLVVTWDVNDALDLKRSSDFKAVLKWGASIPNDPVTNEKSKVVSLMPEDERLQNNIITLNPRQIYWAYTKPWLDHWYIAIEDNNQELARLKISPRDIKFSFYSKGWSKLPGNQKCYLSGALMGLKQRGIIENKVYEFINEKLMAQKCIINDF